MTRPSRRGLVAIPRGIGLVLLGAALAGCYSWRPAPAAAPALIDGERPRVVRATLDDGRVLTLSQPTLVADTIVGMTPGGSERVPTERLGMLEVQRASVPKILGLVVTHVAGFVTAIAIIIDVQPHYRGF